MLIDRCVFESMQHISKLHLTVVTVSQVSKLGFNIEIVCQVNDCVKTKNGALMI